MRPGLLAGSSVVGHDSRHGIKMILEECCGAQAGGSSERLEAHILDGVVIHVHGSPGVETEKMPKAVVRKGRVFDTVRKHFRNFRGRTLKVLGKFVTVGAGKISLRRGGKRIRAGQ